MRYVQHGLTVESELRLAGAPRTDGDGPVDVAIRLVDRVPVPASPPRGRLLGSLSVGGHLRHAVSQVGDQVLLRVPAVVQFTVHQDSGVVIVEADPEAEPGLVEVLASGALFALLLELRSHLVLHASCVTIRGRTVAIVGPSGSGKSTIAALLVTAGAELLADDLVRVDATHNGMQVWPGGLELRLRDGAASLGPLLRGSHRQTGDSRLGVTPDRADGDEPRTLDLLVLPRLRRRSIDVAAQPVPPSDALLGVVAAPRLLGWQDKGIQGRWFRGVGALVREVPTVRLELPWLERSRSDLGGRIAAELEPAAGRP